MHCQRAKIVRHNKAPIQPIAPASDKLGEICADLVGPLPVNKGKRYLLTIIDRFTRWPEAIPLEDARAETVANAFIENWIARFGVPRIVLTDRGAQFTSGLWTSLMKKLGCTAITTTAYNPKCNGLVERFHLTLKNALRCNAGESGEMWLDKLPLVLLNLRNALRSDGDITPSQAMYGQSLTLPSDIVTTTTTGIADVCDYTRKLTRHMLELQPAKSRPIKQPNGYVDPALMEAKYVFVKNNCKRGLQNNYTGPYRVISSNSKYFVLDFPRGKDTVTVDRLKVAHLADDYFVTKQEPRPVIITPALRMQSNLPPRSISVENDATPVADTCENRTRSGRVTRKPDRYGIV